MKKYLILIALSLISIVGYTQTGVFYRINGNILEISRDRLDSTWFILDSNNYEIITTADTFKINEICRIDSIIFNGNRTITRTGLTAAGNVGGRTITEFLNNFFFPTTSPTAAINVTAYGTSKEFASAGTDPITVNWSITRPSSCLQIASVVVRGKTITPTPNPAEGATYSSTLDTTITRNTNTTFTITVTSADAKTGTASTTVSWLWKRYWGAFVSAVPPTDPSFSISNAEILALTGSELSTTYVKSFGTVSTSGNYFIYAFPSSWGTPKFYINGFETAFVLVKDDWNFTNASGGTVIYDVWCSPFEYGASFTLSTTN